MYDTSRGRGRLLYSSVKVVTVLRGSFFPGTFGCVYLAKHNFTEVACVSALTPAQRPAERRRQPLSPGLRTTSRHWSSWHAPEWMPDSVDVSQVVSVPAVLRNHASLQKSIGDNGSRSVLNVQEVNVLREVVHPNVVQVRQCPTSGGCLLSFVEQKALRLWRPRQRRHVSVFCHCW